MKATYSFLDYGHLLSPQEGVLALDVGMKTVPGVIDHHHPNAEVECTASLVVKHPHLVLDHLSSHKSRDREMRIITHRFPDFDAMSSSFLALKLLEQGKVDESMERLASYSKMVDSASLPKQIDLSSTPYSILRALYSTIKKKNEEEINQERVKTGIKFMNFLYSKSEEGYDIFQNRSLFAGVESYEKAIRKCDDDYFNYLQDVTRAEKMRLSLPLSQGQGRKEVDALIIRNPKSFLLKEWARRDREHAPCGKGFGFLMTNMWNKRYILAVDPEAGVNLKGLGDLLNEKEKTKREKSPKSSSYCWYEGNCPFFNYRIIVSPQDETLLTHEEIVGELLLFQKRFAPVSK